MPRKNKSQVLASIDVAAETALVASPVDHDSQLGNWDQAAPETTTDAELEALEALEAVSEPQASEPVQEPQACEPDAASKSFEEVMASFSDEQVEEAVFAIALQLDDRADFEKAKNPDNENIQRTLTKARKLMVTKRAARVLLAANVDPAILNRSVHEGARYNVYAIGKLADAIYGLSGGAVANAINIAVMKSLFRFRAQGLVFTGEMAKAAASDKIRVADNAIKNALVRHTVSASTAPTQASSTMQALRTLGIVNETGLTRNPTYTLTEAPIVAKLDEVLKAAA